MHIMYINPFKEKINRFYIFVSRLASNGRKSILFMALLPVAVLSLIFSVLFINQERLLKQKENMLESYYHPGDKQGPALKDNQEPQKITVHVCGQVKEPDVYEMDEGSRVIDAIKAAGGLSEDAFVDGINLAALLEDSQKIYVPGSQDASGAQGDGLIYEESQNRINLNTATKEQLDSLPGIGPVISQKILDYREKYGGFSDLEELKNISGIGQKKYEEIKDLLFI